MTTLDPAEAYVASIRGIVRQEIAATRFGPFEYVVQTAHPDGTVDILAADTALGLPPFSNLRVWTGLPGSTVQPMFQSHVVVFFLDGNRAKPVAFGFDPTATLPALEPPSIQIGGTTPSPPVPTPGAAARVGDAAGPFLVTSGSSRINLG